MNKHEMPQAYWIAPDGSIYPVFKNHISFVIENPCLFGLAINDITDQYLAENEPIGLEGEARKKIILSLIKRGWIRIRNYPRRGWTINLIEFSQKEKSILHSWAVEMTSCGVSIHDIVNLDLPDGLIRYDLKDLIQEIR